MKKILKKVKKKMKQEIEFAQKAGFEGMLISLDDPESYIYLESIYDHDTLEDIVIENGWDEHCALLDFVEDSQKFLYVQEVAA